MPREIGKRNFHPRFKSWSILNLGKVHLVAIEINRNKNAFDNVIKIPIAIPKILFIPKSSGINMYGKEKFHPPK